MVAVDDLLERFGQWFPHLLTGVERGTNVRREADLETDLLAIEPLDDFDGARREVAIAAGDERSNFARVD